MRLLPLVLAVLAVACNAPSPPRTAALKPTTAVATAVAPTAQAAAPARAAAAEFAPVADAERIAAGQLVQRQLAPRVGPVNIPSIEWVSGVFRVVVQPTAVGVQPMEVFVTRDLSLLFPSAQRLGAALAVPALGEDGFGACLARKGLHLFGDPGQPATQRQLAELGPGGRQLLIDCGNRPAECAALGQTALPVLQLGTQKVAAHMPRAVVAKWTGCAEVDPATPPPATAPLPPAQASPPAARAEPKSGAPGPAAPGPPP